MKRFGLRIGKHLFRSLFMLAAVFVILLALLMSVSRLLLPMAGEYRVEVVRALESYLGTPVQIGDLDLAWKGLGPQVVLRDLSLQNEQRQTLLSVERGLAGLDLLDTLLNWSPRFSALVLEDVSLTLHRDRHGRFGLRGVTAEAGATDGGFPAWLLAVDELSIDGGRLLLIDDLDQRRLQLTDIALHLRNRGQTHALSLTLTPPKAYGAPLALQAQWQGPAERPSEWEGQAYFATDGLQLGHWLQGQQWRGLRVTSGSLGLQAWAGFSAGRLERLQGQLSGQDVQALLLDQDKVLEQASTFRQLQGQWRWLRQAEGWDLQLEDLRLGDGQSPAASLAVSLRGSPDAPAVALQSDRLQLKQIARLALLAPPLEGEARRQLRELQPRGEVRALKLQYRQGPDGPHWQARGQVDGLGLDSAARLPSVSGLGGELLLDDRRLLMRLDSWDAAIDFHGFFPEVMRLQRLRGEALLAFEDDRLVVRAPDVRLRNADIDGRVGLHLSVPKEGSPYLDLFADYERVDVTRVPAYLPHQNMPSAAVNWLNRAFPAAERRATGQSLFHGRLADFPFRHGQGRFESRLRFAGLTLDYRPGWTAGEQMRGELAFLNNGMAIDLREGRVGDVRAVGGEAVIRDFGRALLDLRLEMDGPLADMLVFLRDSPLLEEKGILNELQAQGDARFDFRLAMPLGSAPGERQVGGLLNFGGNRLHLPSAELALDDLQGSLRFDDLRFSSSELQAQLQGRPVRLDVQGLERQGRLQTRVRAELNSAMAPLLKQQFQPLARYTQGKTDWRIDVNVDHGDRRHPLQVNAEVYSSLEGMHMDLPCPLRKTATEALPLTLSFGLGSDSTEPVRMRLGERFSAVLKMQSRAGRQVPVSGELRFHAGQARLPEKEGVRLHGHMREFSLSQWQALAKNLGGPDTNGAILDHVRRIDVSAGQFEALGRWVQGLSVDAEREGRIWRARLSSEPVSGQLRYGPRQGVELDLSQLNVDALLSGEGVAEVQALNNADPRGLPPIRLQARDVIFKGRRVGEAGLRTTPLPNGLQLHHMQAKLNGLQFTAGGRWIVDAENRHHSDLHLGLSGKDLGGTLQQLGLSEAMRGGDVEKADFHFRWPSSPYSPDWQQAEGWGELSLRQGEFVEVQPGAGKLLGLFSLAALPRRLALDFRDVASQGLRFDSVEGRVRLASGILRTERLNIKGASAAIHIEGTADLAEQQLNYQARVMPETSVLPVLGTLAGGATMGAAALVIQQLFRKPLREATAVEYRISGSWSDPVVTRQGGQLPEEQSQNVIELE